MVSNDNQNEHDIVERRVSVGPYVGAGLLFLMLGGTFAAGFYVCKTNTKGDIAESEVEVRKDDSRVALELEQKLAERKDNADQFVADNPYDNDCARITINDMRGGMREPEEY